MKGRQADPASELIAMNYWIIAHRGARAEAPENTAAAFDAALSYPIDGIELDVQLTADNVPVLYHDRTTSKITGRRSRISDFSLAELKEMDWGGWYGKSFTGQVVMRLDEVLDKYAPKTRLFVEIKSRKPERRSGRSMALARIVMDLVEKRVPKERRSGIHIVSFDPAVLKLAFESGPDYGFILNLRECPVNLAKEEPLPDYLSGVGIAIKKLTPAFAEYVHAGRRKLMTWACNTPRQASKALDLNVDIILTDNPGWFTSRMGSEMK